MKNAFLLILGLFVLTHVFYLDSFLWYDEAGWGADLDDFTSLEHTPRNIPHMPLAMIFYKFSTVLFGENNYAMRLVPFLFGLGILLLLYSLAKRTYGKGTALVSSLLLAIGFWPTVATSIIDLDGAVLSFFVLLTFYFFVRAEKEKGYWFFLVGLGLVLCTLTRMITGGLLLFIIFSYYCVLSYLEKGKINRYARQFLFILGSFIVIGVPVLFLLYLQNPGFYGELYLTPIELLFGVVSGGGGWSRLTKYLLSFSMLLWATPLLIFPLFCRKASRKDLLFYLIIIIIFVVFIASGRGGDPARYSSIMIPYLALLCGDWLYKERKKFDAPLFWILGGLCLIAFFVYNWLLPFHPPNNYVEFIRNLSENFLGTLFIYSGSSVNPFYISFFIIFFVFLISFILYFFRNVSLRYVITIFLAVNIAFNVFLIVEYNFALTQPDVKAVGKEMMEKIGPYLDGQLAVDYANYEAFEFYYGYEEEDFVSLSPFNLFFTTYDAQQVSEVLNIEGKQLFFIDYLKTPKNEIWELFGKCELLATSSSKGEVLGYFYQC